MKILMIAAALAIFATDASAISRYQSTAMSCGQVQHVVRNEGAAILRWNSKRNPSLPIFGKYVSDSRFCESNEVATLATVPTADRRACVVRKCVEHDPFPRFRRRLHSPG